MKVAVKRKSAKKIIKACSKKTGCTFFVKNVRTQSRFKVINHSAGPSGKPKESKK